MDFESLKEQLLDQYKELSQKIGENETFLMLAERYNNLSPVIQRSIIGGIVFLFFYVLYTIPSGSMASSESHYSNFELQRATTEDLYKAGAITSGGSQSNGLGRTQLESQVKRDLKTQQVLDSQVSPFKSVAAPISAKKVPKEIEQIGLSFEIKKMNLKQFTNISSRLASINPNTKLTNISMKADKEDPHYFNVSYTLSSLNLKQAPQPAAAKGKRGSSRSSRFPKKKGR